MNEPSQDQQRGGAWGTADTAATRPRLGGPTRQAIEELLYEELADAYSRRLAEGVPAEELARSIEQGSQRLRRLLSASTAQDVEDRGDDAVEFGGVVE